MELNMYFIIMINVTLNYLSIVFYFTNIIKFVLHCLNQTPTIYQDLAWLPSKANISKCHVE